MTIAASVCILLTGCTKSGPALVCEVSDGDSPVISTDEIFFTVGNGENATKSDPVSLTQSFNVEAYLQSPRIKYFNAKDYTYTSGSFTSATPFFWPVSGKMDFYAVSPLKYTDTSSSQQTLAVSDSSFTLTKFDGKTDILTARIVGAAKTEPSTPVALMFNHKLTKVSFKAMGMDPTKMYKLYSMVVTANSSAKYSFGPTENWGVSSTPYGYEFLESPATIPAETQTAIPVGETRYLIPSQSSASASLLYSVYKDGVRTDTTVAPIVVPLPTTSWGINKSVVYNLKIIEGVLSGIFTVGAGPDGKEGTADDVRVRFAKGNMYYDGTSFNFENNQYTTSSSWQADHISHFYWSKNESVSVALTYSDSSKSSTDVFFTNDPTDISKPNPNFTICGATGVWRTLTGGEGEWKYLINKRGNGSKWSFATVSGVVGLIILPDTFTDPKTNTATGASNGSFVPGKNSDYSANIYPSGGNWEAMEAAGAVFFPAAGWRSGSLIKEPALGRYGSASAPQDSDNLAHYLRFCKGDPVGTNNKNNRSYGYTVRLVCPL